MTQKITLRKHDRRSAAQKVFSEAGPKPKPPTGPGVRLSAVQKSPVSLPVETTPAPGTRLSAAQKDAGMPPVESGEVVETPVRLSAAQKAAVVVKKTEVAPTKPVRKTKKKAKPTEGFAANFEPKKPCNSCPDEEG